MITFGDLVVFQQPPPAAPPSVIELAEWWDILNAIAQSVGALGTAGALLIAALGYRRQQQNQHRAQASRVAFRANQSSSVLQLDISNHGDLPIVAGQVLDIVRPSTLTSNFGSFEWSLLLAVKAGRRRLIPVYSDTTDEERGLGLEYHISGYVGDIEPGQTISVFPSNLPLYTQWHAHYALRFVDQRGRTWIVTTWQQLYEARDFEPSYSMLSRFVPGRYDRARRRTDRLQHRIAADRQKGLAEVAGRTVDRGVDDDDPVVEA